MSRDKIPTHSLLMRAIIIEDYASAIDIISAKDFDPNERTKAWNAPIVSALINLLGGVKSFHDKQAVKEIFKGIVTNEKFDPNLVDSEGYTVLMHIAERSEFNWLAPFILLKKGVNLSLKSYTNHDVFSISERKKNKVLLDILLTYNGTHSKGMPKKRAGIKPIAKVTSTEVPIGSKRNPVNRIEFAFSEEQKDNPVSLYWLLYYFLSKDYDNCLKVVNNVHFDPNENDKWGEPVISSLMYYSQDKDVNYDEEKYKEIAKAIMSNRKFDMNALDADCNTPIMIAMGYQRLHWLVKELFKFSSTRIDIMNDQGETLKDIAKYSGNENFFNELISKIPTPVEVS